MEWEAHACQLANAEGTEEELASVVLAICDSAGVDAKNWVSVLGVSDRGGWTSGKACE